jgi:hypothetical protein
MAGLAAGSLLLCSLEAQAVTGPVSPVAPGSGVVALGTLPVACGAAFSIDCSGVLLSPTLVLTAAHCVPSGVVTGRHQVLTGAGVVVDVTRTYVHPGYEAAPGGADLAVLALDAPVHGVASPSVSLDEAMPETLATIQGFGATEATGSVQSTALSGTVRIAALADGVVELLPEPNMVCDGDSGGPLLVTGERGVELLGIISQANPACTEWGTATWLGSASSRAFIDDVLAREQALVDAGQEHQADEPPDYSLLCELPCQADADCPRGARCVGASETDGRCVPPGLFPGRVDGPCDDSCDQCVQLSARVADCSCYRFCPAPEDESAAPKREHTAPSCAVSSGAGLAPQQNPWLRTLSLAVLLLGLLRPRGRRA